jgi:hypothetical protein
MRWVEEQTKAQAWGCPCITPRNIEEVQASKLGDAPEAALLHRQKSGHLSRHYIFIASCTMHFSWTSVVLVFVISFVLFAEINGWKHHVGLEEDILHFHLPRKLCFSLLSFQRVFSFSATAFSLHFLPWFLFRSCFIFASRCIWTSGICWFPSKEFPQKVLNGVRKEKKIYAKKKWYKKELV